MGIVGDSSLINPYGVRVKGFCCGVTGLRVAWDSGLGLRVLQSSGSGLRVRSLDGHVILLIPQYLTEVFCCSFPSSSSPLFFTIDLLPILLLLQLKMTTPFVQYVDGMVADHPVFNTPLQLVGFYLFDLFCESF